MADYSFIDIHMHTYPAPEIAIQAMGGKARAGFTGTHAELMPFMEEAGIEKAILLNFTPVADMVAAFRSRWPADLTPSQRNEREEALRLDMVSRVKRRNAWSCEEAKVHPNLVAFICVDPVMDEQTMVEEIEGWAKQGVKGIKLHPPVQRVAVNDRRFWPAYATAERLGMVVLTHMGPFGDIPGHYAHPALFAEVAEAFPKLFAVLAHCGSRENYDAAIALAKERPNVAFDCCGVPSSHPGHKDLDDTELTNLFRSLGTDRVAFGSDWCFRDPRPDVQRIEQLPMTKEEKRMILRDNTVRWLRLDS